MRQRTGTSFTAPSAFSNNQNTALWAGCALTAELPFPIKVSADGVYGEAFVTDRKQCRRYGWFVDAAVEYTGLTAFAPQLLGWWGSGEDSGVSTKLIALCEEYTGAMGRFGTEPRQIDTLVLGCTHYPFAEPQLRALVGPQVHPLELVVARLQCLVYPGLGRGGRVPAIGLEQW